VLIAGGGAAAMEAALTLTELLGDRVDVELIAPEPSWSYRPLSVVVPFAKAGPRVYAADALADLGVRIRRDSLAAVDAERRRVTLGSGATLRYDALLIATGVRPERAFDHVTSALDSSSLHGMVQDVEGGYYREIAFIAPRGAAWTLPLYELCLQLAERTEGLCLGDVDIVLITHERRPLEIFGSAASSLVERLLANAGVRLVTGAYPHVSRGRWIRTAPDALVDYADRVVAMPVARGVPIEGLAATPHGFLAVDDFGRVVGTERVYAAGDITDHPIKQGGLATQQADAAAAAIAADLGFAVAPEPFEPVLRGLLITGSAGWFLRRNMAADATGEVSREPLWWPPSKIAGRRLTPFLDGIDAATGAQRVERQISRPRGGARRRAVIARTSDGVVAVND
jgi:sulfide:quinone oxidoreductase